MSRWAALSFRAALLVLLLAVGFGAVAAILWELGEYVSFIRGNANEVRTAYTDTLGDLSPGLTGSVVGPTAAVLLARSFNEARSSLEEQWSRGDDVSTEDLRITLQRYRSFFERLLEV